MTAKYRRVANASSVRQIIVLSIAASLVILIADRGTAADNDRGAQLAAICASCHRLDGRDKGIPSIVGMDKEKLAGAMAAFKSGERSSQIMHAVALSLSDDEIATAGGVSRRATKGDQAAMTWYASQVRLLCGSDLSRGARRASGEKPSSARGSS